MYDREAGSIKITDEKLVSIKELEVCSTIF